MKYLIPILFLFSCQKEEVLHTCGEFITTYEYNETCYDVSFLQGYIYFSECYGDIKKGDLICDDLIYSRDLFPEITEWILVLGELMKKASGKVYFPSQQISPE